ncbi:11094_t:CDS:2, partial [Scutellospora calospora]
MDESSSRRSSTQSTATKTSRGTDIQHQHRITRATARNNQEANLVVNENIPQQLRYYFRRREINMDIQPEPMDIDEPAVLEISDNTVRDDTNMMNMDHPDAGLNSDGNDIESEIINHNAEIEHDTDSDDESIQHHDIITNEVREEIVNQRISLPDDVRDALLAIARTKANSDQLGRLANHFLSDSNPLTNWNLTLLVHKLAEIIKKESVTGGIPPEFMFSGAGDMDPLVMQSLIDSAIFSNDPADSNVITMASRCLSNLVTKLGRNAEPMIGPAINEKVVPLLCDILTEGPQTNDSEHLKAIIIALYQFSKPYRINCSRYIVNRRVLPHIFGSILPFFADGDRLLPLKLLANCCQNAPRDCYKILMDEIINGDDFKCLFADYEPPYVVRRCSLVISYMTSLYPDDLNSFRIFSNDNVIRLMVENVNVFSDENSNKPDDDLNEDECKLHIWKMFTTLTTKSPVNLARIFQHGIVRALYETLTHTPAPFFDHRDTTKMMVEKVQKNQRNAKSRLESYNLCKCIFNFILRLFPSLPRTGIEKVDIDDMSVDHEDSPPAFMSEEQTKAFACLILPALIQAYYSTNISTEAKTWEIRAMIIDCVVVFIHYLDNELIHDILEQAEIQDFLETVFKATYYVSNVNDSHVKHVFKQGMEIVAQCLDSWGETFEKKFA